MIKVEKGKALYEGTVNNLLAEYIVATKGLINTLTKTGKISQTQAKLVVLNAFKIGMEEE